MTTRPSAPDPTDIAGRNSVTARQVTADLVTVPRLELRVEQEGGQPAARAVVLEGDDLRVGSHPANELVIAGESISPFHFRLTRTSLGFRIIDSGSRAGTRVNGVLVRDADLPLPECAIEVGDALVRVSDRGTAGEFGVSPALSIGALYGGSVPMRRIFEVIKRCGRRDADVLIEGESGTGKDLCAGEIVRLSARASGPFAVVDCGAVSPELIESELFGHVRGAFTGAERDRPGAFEVADGGTLFLDEIGELPLSMQPKLLRALAAREVRRVGDNRVRKVNVRLIAATNRRLEREVNAGRFREDLFFRVSVLTVRMPPLRERLDDIPLLIDHFLNQRGANRRHLFGPEVIEELMRHSFPGNVRELRNWVERRVVFEREAELPGRDAPVSTRPPAPAPPSIERPFKEAKDAVVSAFERAYVEVLLRETGGNISKAARKAQIDRISVLRLLQRHGLRGGS